MRSGAREAESVYNDSLALGWDFQSDADAVALVADFTGEAPVAVAAPILELELAQVTDHSHPWLSAPSM